LLPSWHKRKNPFNNKNRPPLLPPSPLLLNRTKLDKVMETRKSATETEARKTRSD